MILDLETRRQGVHLFTGVFFALVIQLCSVDCGLAFLSFMALGTFTVSRLIQRDRNIPVFSWLVKKTERKGKAPASGVSWYFLGVLLIFVASLYLGIDKIYTVAAMLVVAVGDSICTGLGRKIGTKRLPRTSTKSYEGSLIGFGAAFFAAAFVLKLIMPAAPSMAIAASGAVVGMLTEAYVRCIDDNLSIPVLSWLAMVVTASLLGML